MSDAIVKSQDQLPLPRVEVLRIIRDALEAYRKAGGKIVPPRVLASVELVELKHAENALLVIELAGPAGDEVFTIGARTGVRRDGGGDAP